MPPCRIGTNLDNTKAVVPGVTVTFAVIAGANVVNVNDRVAGVTCSAKTGENPFIETLAADGITITPLVTSADGAKAVRDRLFVPGIAFSASAGAKEDVTSETGFGTTRTFAEIVTAGASVESANVFVDGIRLS